MSFQDMINRLIIPVKSKYEINTCPNCWGTSQWAGKDCPEYFDIDKGTAIEVKSRNGFIRNFVKRFVG